LRSGFLNANIIASVRSSGFSANIGEKTVRLPFFVPKTEYEGEMLEFAKKYCGEGLYLIFPGKRIFKYSHGDLKEATSEDIIKLVFHIE